MDDWSDLQDALSSEHIYGVEIPEARPDALITIESLPAELLHDIIDFSSSKSVLSLMRVNHLFHDVCLQKFYGNVYLPGGLYASHLKTLDPILPDEELFSTMHHKRLGVLGGLLRTKRHIAIMKTLNVVSFPSPLGPEHTIFNRILRYIVQNATSIHTINLPFANITPSATFDGLILPSSLNTLNSEIFRSDLVKVIMWTGRLHTLRINFQCASLEDWQVIAAQMPDTLRHLACFVHIPAGKWGSSASETVAFVSKLSNLVDLTFGYCNCHLAASPDPEVPIHNYTLLASALPSLTSLTIVDRRSGSFQQRADGIREFALISALSHANQNLQEISVQYMFRTRVNNYDGENFRTIVWTAASPEVVELSRSAMGEPHVWTPAPHFRSRWFFWHDTFGDSSTVLGAMKLRWSSNRWSRLKKGGSVAIQSLPSVRELEKTMDVLRSIDRIGHRGT